MKTMRYMETEMNLEFKLCNCKNSIKAIKENNKMDWLIIFILILMTWFFAGLLVEQMIKEEEEKRNKYDVPERYKLK